MPCKLCNRDSKVWARGFCKTCYDKDLKQRNPEYVAKQKQNTREWILNNPEKYKSIVKRRQAKQAADPSFKYRRSKWAAKRKYNISDAEYDTLLTQTSCAICGSEHKLCIDHNHKTGTVRERLCKGCNFALGFIERTEWLIRAQQYLQKHGDN